MSGDAPKTWSLGWVLGARGLEGDVRVRLLLPDPNAFEAGKLLLDDDAYNIIDLQWHDERNAYLRLAGVNSRTAADALKGKAVSVDPGWFDDDMPRPAASYLGLMAVNDETDDNIAPVMEVAHNGAQIILVIGRGNKERLVPLVDEFITAVTESQIRIRAIPGLLE